MLAFNAGFHDVDWRRLKRVVLARRAGMKFREIADDMGFGQTRAREIYIKGLRYAHAGRQELSDLLPILRNERRYVGLPKLFDDDPEGQDGTRPTE